MASKSNILETTADQLMELVSAEEKLSIEEAAKKLKVSSKTIQGLVDFLVEEKILGMEYKFTTPYIYLADKKKKKEQKIKEESPELVSKEEFYEKARSRNVPYQTIEILWKKYLEEQLKDLKKTFFNKARQRKIPDEKIEILWKKYLSYI